MSNYEPSSPESDVQCFSPGSCGDSSLHSTRKCNPVEKTKRLKASARERKRRHVLNDALEALRIKVSSFNNQNPHKLSKIEVLRHAIDYIAMLTYYLEATSPAYTDTYISAMHQPHILMQHGATTHVFDQRKQVSLASNFLLYSSNRLQFVYTYFKSSEQSLDKTSFEFD